MTSPSRIVYPEARQTCHKTELDRREWFLIHQRTVMTSDSMKFRQVCRAHLPRLMSFRGRRVIIAATRSRSTTTTRGRRTRVPRRRTSSVMESVAPKNKKSIHVEIKLSLWVVDKLKVLWCPTIQKIFKGGRESQIHLPPRSLVLISVGFLRFSSANTTVSSRPRRR